MDTLRDGNVLYHNIDLRLEKADAAAWVARNSPLVMRCGGGQQGKIRIVFPIRCSTVACTERDREWC